MKQEVTDEDVKVLQKIQKKLLGHELPKDISRDSLENTPLSELMNEYYQTYLTYFDEIRKEKTRDKIGVDFVRGGFIGLFVGLIISWTEGGGDIFRIVLVGGLIGGFVGAFAPPILEVINRYSERNNL